MLDRQRGIHAPGGDDLNRAAAVAESGQARLVLDRVGDIGMPNTGGHIPGLAIAQVLQQEELTTGVADGVVGPGRELVQSAVTGPGEAGAALRHQRTETRVGQYIDPGPWRATVGAHRQRKTAADRVEAALDRRVDCRVGRHPRRRRQPGAVDLDTLRQRVIVPLHQVGHLLRQRAPVSVQAHAGMHGQRRALGGTQLFKVHQRQAGRRCRCSATPPQHLGQLGVVALGQLLQLGMQRHQVGARLAVLQHQIAAQAAPGPPAQRPNE